MKTERICPSCGRPLAAGSPQGLCPECLMKAGFGTGVAPGPGEPTSQPPFVAPTPEAIGRHFPHLEILGLIGQGGMGAVYRARQKELDRVVALKILPPGIGKDPAFAQRFTREAKALAKLNHTGIVTLYEFGKADGLFFFLMEFVDGVSLRHLIEVGRISPREALAIVPQICDALQYAHDQGIVHRDIKPANILLDRQGRVKVADFGLVKLVGPEEPEARAPGDPMGEAGAAAPADGIPAPAALTDPGSVMGTPQYMAPEQREHPTEVDQRADIYSLGVVFYQMLTGELPGKPIELPSRKVHVDVRLDEVILRALEREPERRYQQVSQVKSAVESIGSTAAPVRSSAGEQPTVKAAASEIPNLERVKNARRLVRWPATGLMAIGLCFPVVGGCFLAFGQWPANWQGALALLPVLFIDYVIILGSWRMRQLKDYRMAVLAAIVSLVITLPGLPLAVFPIWALMVLYRPDVRAAFNEVARKRASAPAATPNGAAPKDTA